MSKFMDPVEFAEWCEKPGRTLAEIEAMAVELQGQVREVTLDAAGVSLEDYQGLPRDWRAEVEDEGAQALEQADFQETAEVTASDAEQQAAVQQEFCDRHPEHFPSELNGNIFAEAYAEAWLESNPGVDCYWEIGAMEALYQALVESGAFPVTRNYKN